MLLLPWHLLNQEEALDIKIRANVVISYISEDLVNLITVYMVSNDPLDLLKLSIYQTVLPFLAQRHEILAQAGAS